MAVDVSRQIVKKLFMLRLTQSSQIFDHKATHVLFIWSIDRRKSGYLFTDVRYAIRSPYIVWKNTNHCHVNINLWLIMTIVNKTGNESTMWIATLFKRYQMSLFDERENIIPQQIFVDKPPSPTNLNWWNSTCHYLYNRFIFFNVCWILLDICNDFNGYVMQNRQVRHRMCPLKPSLCLQIYVS